MSARVEQWVQQEYIRLILLADQLLGKEKLVDFYYGNFIPRREKAPLLPQDLLPPLQELLQLSDEKLSDTPPFYIKSTLHQQLVSFIGHLEKAVSGEGPGYAALLELLLGVRPVEPEWRKQRDRLEHVLREAGYDDSCAEMLKQWQEEGLTDVFGFMELAREQVPSLWERLRARMLPLFLSEDEIDFLQGSSQVKFCYLDNLWEDWPYYGGYRRGYMSMIALNARLNWNRFQVKALLAYEVLPGRHLLWLLRQRFHALSRLPEVAMLATFASPERLVQEGIIAAAPEFLWPRGVDDAREQVAFEHWKLQRLVGWAAAVRLFCRREPAQEVQRFIQEEALLPPGRAKALLQGIQEHPYQYPSAQLGYELVKDLWRAAGDDFCLAIPSYHSPASLRKFCAVAGGGGRKERASGC